MYFIPSFLRKSVVHRCLLSPYKNIPQNRNTCGKGSTLGFSGNCGEQLCIWTHGNLLLSACLMLWGLCDVTAGFLFLMCSEKPKAMLCSAVGELVYLQPESSSCSGPTQTSVTARAVHHPVHTLLVPLLGSPTGLGLVTPHISSAGSEVPITCACCFWEKSFHYCLPVGWEEWFFL